MQEIPNRDATTWLGCMMLVCTLVTGFGLGLMTMFILFKLA